MGSDVVVVNEPVCGFASSSSKAEERVFVEELVTDARVEAFDVGVLRWFAGRDEVESNVAFR